MRIPWKEALGVALDCHRYFILGQTGRYSGGLVNLFDKMWQRTPGDYYPAVSELCLDHEQWLADPASWTRDEVMEFAYEFYGIVPQDEPNYYPMGNPWKFRKYERAGGR